jgi:hypothetical protein
MSFVIVSFLVRRSNLGSSTTNLPLDVFDAHFLASLVVVVVPLAFRKIDG